MLRIFRHYLPASALLLFVCEGVVIVAVFFAAARVAAFMQPIRADLAQRNAAAILFAGVLTSVLMYAIGLYDHWLIVDLRRAVPRLVVCFVVSTPIIVLFWLVVLPNPGGLADANKAVIYSLWVALAFGASVLLRVIFAAVSRATNAPRRVLVVGTGRLAAEIESLMSEIGHSNTMVVGYTNLTDEVAQVPAERIRPRAVSLLAMARRDGIREIVIALDDRRGVPLQALLEARMEGITITSYLSFWERETRRLNLGALDPGWLIYSDGFQTGSEVNVVLKRALDVAASLVLLVAMAPLLVICAVVIRMTSRGPILYTQSRVGRNGTEFTMYKFRTMRVDAESSGVPQWAALSDPRVTPIGLFLRTMRIDELPQIFNVLRGDMSFVGPRPERQFFVESLTKEIPFYAERHRVRPGITGWAQINHPYGASIEDAKAKLSYDLYYIKNYSFIFDILIILSTARAVFLNRGGR